MSKISKLFTLPSLALAGLLFPISHCWAQTVTKADCEALRGFTIAASDIALPITGASVEATVWVDATTDAKPPVCVATGAINPVHTGSPAIQFEVTLPETWNGKAVQLGGGGYDGVIARRANFLPQQPSEKGYASYGSDSGHQGSSLSAAFALDQEALENYAVAQIKKTHDVATALFKRFYGKAAQRTYIYGNSHGGNEALRAIHDYPSDYDGAIAIHPAYATIANQLGGLMASQFVYRSSDSWVSPSQFRAVGQAVLTACDDLDGAHDGLIANTAACRSTFKIESLRCPKKINSDSNCLSDAQLATLKKLVSGVQFGFALQGGVSAYGGWPVLEGAFTDPQRPDGWGNRPLPSTPPTIGEDAFQLIMADQAIRYIVTKNAATNSLMLAPRRHIAEFEEASKLLDASDPNLDAFFGHGGKLLLMHGTVDMAIPIKSTIRYYAALKKRYGQNLMNSVKFYVAPGFGHGNGPFRVIWDSLDELDGWVSGTVPGPQTVVDISVAGAGRSRPLCEYPQWPRYKGTGDLQSAVSFECVK